MELSIQELKALFPPFPCVESGKRAEVYWSDKSWEDRLEANRVLLREFYRLQGVDIDAPMDRSVVRRVSREQKNCEHADWHAAIERFILQR